MRYHFATLFPFAAPRQQRHRTHDTEQDTGPNDPGHTLSDIEVVVGDIKGVVNEVIPFIRQTEVVSEHPDQIRYHRRQSGQHEPDKSGTAETPKPGPGAADQSQYQCRNAK